MQTARGGEEHLCIYACRERGGGKGKEGGHLAPAFNLQVEATCGKCSGRRVRTAHLGVHAGQQPRHGAHNCHKQRAVAVAGEAKGPGCVGQVLCVLKAGKGEGGKEGNLLGNEWSPQTAIQI